MAAKFCPFCCSIDINFIPAFQNFKKEKEAESYHLKHGSAIFMKFLFFHQNIAPQKLKIINYDVVNWLA